MPVRVTPVLTFYLPPFATFDLYLLIVVITFIVIYDSLFWVAALTFATFDGVYFVVGLLLRYCLACPVTPLFPLLLLLPYVDYPVDCFVDYCSCCSFVVVVAAVVITAITCRYGRYVAGDGGSTFPV